MTKSKAGGVSKIEKNKTNLPNNPVSVHAKFKSIADDSIIFQIFGLVEQNPDISQRRIKLQTGLAAGLVHSYMSRIISKGWVRARKVNAKRWLYFMTPDGFLEKSRLTVKYLGRFFRNYKVAQSVIEDYLDDCGENGMCRLVVVGDNELADIVSLNIKASKELTLEAMLVMDQHNGKDPDQREGRYPFDAIKDLKYDRIIVCDPSFTLWAERNDFGGQFERLYDTVGKVLGNSE